jgi:UPF0755 protein
VVCGLCALALLGLLSRHLLLPAETTWSGVFFIESGSDASSIAARLDSLGLLSSRIVWLGFARLSGAEKHLKTGPYALEGLSPLQILEAFRAGRILEQEVTVQEGLTVWEVAALIEEEVGTSREAFLELAGTRRLLERVASPGPTLEGYLFPDTYRLHLRVTADQVIGSMVGRFLEVWGELAESGEPPQSLSRHELVTMASLVEAEAALDPERPRIAAVYYNRLRIGMRLMADPTVAYALGRRPRRLLYKDLEVDSPYNTYLYQGLPPGPICSPGRASLAAALSPLEGCNDLYFVAAGDGSHVFSRTHREHLRAKAAVRGGRTRSSTWGSSAGKNGSRHR